MAFRASAQYVCELLVKKCRIAFHLETDLPWAPIAADNPGPDSPPSAELYAVKPVVSNAVRLVVSRRGDPEGWAQRAGPAQPSQQ